MLYKPDWDKVRERYIQYWACENHESPLLCLTAPKDKKVPRPQKEHAGDEKAGRLHPLLRSRCTRRGEF
jgi:hypothetical protein